ncbi:Gmad2 immunoglobulin-like domain-containing protein [Peribacillus alkalitolerans]|uniref:Gmad2 immunoglobulin-like domain-containing protein n=1 Tax=Peribacillus alkalitolerans TaxID=1550385 RepID=UPI0013D1837D|nr:Gmad2 immunoglobulin-like domain-containing protein [Peribacillus alkalitolerans]
MNKSLFLSVLIAILVTLTSCGQQDNTSEPISKEEKRYENDAFKEVMIKEEEDHLVVTGKARVFEGNFQYAIIKDSTIVKQDFYQTDGAPAWGDFEIIIEKELKGTELELFVYSAKDGSKIDVLKIPLTNH